MIIAMAGSSKEETFSNETKKKLKTPMPYSGKIEDLGKFLQELRSRFISWEMKDFTLVTKTRYSLYSLI